MMKFSPPSGGALDFTQLIPSDDEEALLVPRWGIRKPGDEISRSTMRITPAIIARSALPSGFVVEEQQLSTMATTIPICAARASREDAFAECRAANPTSRRTSTAHPFR